jgi:hypothetical protein
MTTETHPDGLTANRLACMIAPTEAMAPANDEMDKLFVDAIAFASMTLSRCGFVPASVMCIGDSGSRLLTPSSSCHGPDLAPAFEETIRLMCIQLAARVVVVIVQGLVGTTDRRDGPKQAGVMVIGETRRSRKMKFFPFERNHRGDLAICANSLVLQSNVSNTMFTDLLTREMPTRTMRRQAFKKLQAMGAIPKK